VRVISRCLVLSMGCLLLASSADAQVALAGCWNGQLERDGLRWDIGLDVSEGAGGLVATIDVTSLWLARQELPSFLADERDVQFDLPWEMGGFAGRLDRDRLSGAVTFQDGRRSPLGFDRTPCRTTVATELSWRTDDVAIEGTLTVPSGEGPFPAIVVLHGGGDSSRDSPPYAFWGDYLPRLGIACLLYDKRGNGGSTGDWQQVGFEERARDVAGGLARLRSEPSIDATQLGLLAVSQGSWIAGLVARSDPSVRFVAHVSGPAVPVVEADTYAVEAELRRDGWAERDSDERLRLWQLNAEVARDPDSDEAWERLQAGIEAVRQRPWFQTNPYDPDRRSPWRTWYREVLDYDPRPVLEALDIPMLWVFGAMDSESDPARNISILEDFRRAGKDYTIAMYPQTGHGLLVPVDARGQDADLLTTAPGFFPDLKWWLYTQIDLSQ